MRGMPRDIIEYVAVSIDVGMHGDPDAKDLADLRRVMAKFWQYPRDLVRIGRSSTMNRFIVGYYGIDMGKNLYYWVDTEGVAREFDPKNGKLGKVIKLPVREQKLIWEEETWALGEGLIKSRSIKRRP